MDLLAFAKLNLTLEVLRRREDGYHEIRTVMQAVDIADHLTLEPSPGLVFDGSLPGLALEDNLVYRAAKLLQKETGTKAGARITLRKAIPIAGGLGGGSSDAAATLRGLNELWELGLSVPQLQALGTRLGSDVAFFIQGGTALAEGRGDVLTQLPDVPETWFVLACLPQALQGKTKELYSRMNARLFSDGGKGRLLAAELAAGKTPSAVYFCNVFEGLSFGVFAELREFYGEFVRVGALGVRMSGTGPSLFSMVPSQAAGRDLLQRCDRRGMPAYLVKSVARYL